MKQQKLSFSLPEEKTPARQRYAYLELLSHGAYVCEESTRIVFRNSFAASAFPQIRTGMLLSRFCPLSLSDGALSIRPFQGFMRYFLCKYLPGGRFEVQIAGGLVLSEEQMPREGPQVRMLLESVRQAAKRLSELPLPQRRSASPSEAPGDLAEMLKRCLRDLESPEDPNPRLTVAVRDLLEAVRRRTKSDLEQSDTRFDYDCPRGVLCSARITPVVFILLNLICFFRLCVGQKQIFVQAREQGNELALEMSGSVLFSPTPFYAALFAKNNPRALDQALLATPFSLAAATAMREELSLDCRFQGERMVVTLRLPLQKGTADLTVIDPDGLESQLAQKGVSRPVRSLLRLIKDL